jgi:hypothetical protein
MYSTAIVERRLYAARKAGLTYRRLPRADSIEIAGKLERLRHDKHGRPLPEGQLARPVNPDEQAHIDSELSICKCDLEYFFLRYYSLRIDPGVGMGGDQDSLKIGPPPELLESQKRFIHLLGRREEECAEERKKYKFTVGIHAYFHKVRQVAATATARAMTLHRMLFWPGQHCFAASLDEPRVSELFSRDHTAIDRLPFWMKPKMYPDVKDTEIGFESPISTRCVYQAENQQQGRGGLGVGMQLDVSHLTEVALWQGPSYIDFSFWPAIPKASTTLHIEESTANGKGYWQEVTEAARHKKRGFEHWVYAFIPWYFNKMKYRDIVAPNWVPDEHTIRHGALIERTSPEFNDGVVYRPTLEQLYWWESTRASYIRKMALAEFLTNYPATPEQSFQNPQQGALPAELLETMEQDCGDFDAFDVEIAA